MNTKAYLEAIDRGFKAGHSLVVLDGFPLWALDAVLDELDGVVHEESWNSQCVGDEYGAEWASGVFGAVQGEGQYLVTLAQFIRLTELFDVKLFEKKGVVIVKENLRVAFPLDSDEFLDQKSYDVMADMTDELPGHHVEHLKRADSTYFFQGYSSKLPVEPVFSKTKKLKEVEGKGHSRVEISSNSHELELALCDLIENPLEEPHHMQLVTSPKLEIDENLKKRLERIQAAGLNIVFSVSAKHKNLEEREDSDHSKELLTRYWGDGAAFRKISVYEDPDLNHDVVQISQGQVVDAILEEMDVARNGSLPRDVFLTAPTGAGKSLLFQLPAFHAAEQGDITIVISPLIALMKDQVASIRADRGFQEVEYINSELSYLDRQRILDEVKEEKVHVLYLSPELLLSYDIKHFIGERRIGLLVIDEAHLITTWGRDFRVDYWFLGNHLRKIKNYHGLKFPIVAVTATAVYGGMNDMVFDTLSSLEMVNPHMFIGAVRREDIHFVIRNTQPEAKGQNYKAWKIEQTELFVKSLHGKSSAKALVYAPFKKEIGTLQSRLERKFPGKTALYHGSLDADEKQSAFDGFLKGEIQTMFCTKAFGMGVDISDIQVVYHHAPSGHLPDYVQEIGRLARKPGLTGWASLDYSEKDKYFMNTLFGMSSLKHFELQGVLQKLLANWKAKKSRNMLVSIGDFAHIFENVDESSLDQKVKTALMMIEKDYLRRFQFNVVIARPKALFTKVFARIKDAEWDRVNREYPGCLREIPNNTFSDRSWRLCVIDLERLWKNHFQDESFPKLKFQFYQGNLFRSIAEVVPLMKFDLTVDGSVEASGEHLDKVFGSLRNGFAALGTAFWKPEQLESALRQSLGKKEAKKVVRFVLNAYSSSKSGLTGKLANSSAFLQGRGSGDEREYRVFNSSHRGVFAAMRKDFGRVFKNGAEAVRYRQANDNGAEQLYRLGQWLEILGEGSVAAAGGENPMIFIRVNDPFKLEKDVASKFYQNGILEKTRNKHTVSTQIFDHFFQRSFSDVERWDFIEGFFLGQEVDELLTEFPGKNPSYSGDPVDQMNLVALESNVSESDMEKRETRKVSAKGYYNLEDTVTLRYQGRLTTKKVSAWLAEDAVGFHQTASEMGIAASGEAFKIMITKLRLDKAYFAKAFGTKRKVTIPRLKKSAQVSVFLKDHPVEFYKWWLENRVEVVLPMADRLQLLVKLESLGVSLSSEDAVWKEKLKKR